MPDGHVQTGRSDPDRSLPGYHIKIEYNAIFVMFSRDVSSQSNSIIDSQDKTYLTFSPISTGVRCTKIFTSKFSAALEWVASVSYKYNFYNIYRTTSQYAFDFLISFKYFDIVVYL